MFTSVHKSIAAAIVGFMLLPAIALAHEDSGESKGKMGLRLAGQATVTAVSASGMTVMDKNDASIALLFNSDTSFRYRGGKGTAADIRVGDSLRLVAHRDASGNWIARKVLFFSVRRKTVHGEVSNRTDSGFDVATKHSGSVYAAVNADTAYRVEGKSEPATYADVANGATVTVRGKWSLTSSTFLDVNKVLIN